MGMNKCQHCNQETKNIKFCSRRCSGLSAPRPSKKLLTSETCGCCGTKFSIKTGGQRFCSRSCAAKVNNKLFPKRTPSEVSDGICKHCGKDFSGQDGWKRINCCSRECSGKYTKKQMIDGWLSGELGTTKHGLSKAIRVFLIEQAGSKCSRCGWSEVNETTKSVPLQIDHVDGNAFNNAPENLVVLCPNCHSLTATFGALNRGKSTRAYRYNS